MMFPACAVTLSGHGLLGDGSPRPWFARWYLRQWPVCLSGGGGSSTALREQILGPPAIQPEGPQGIIRGGDTEDDMDRPDTGVTATFANEIDLDGCAQPTPTTG